MLGCQGVFENDLIGFNSGLMLDSAVKTDQIPPEILQIPGGIGVELDLVS
jgi:hypothetical protein